MLTLKQYARIFFSVFSPLYFGLFISFWFLARVYLGQGDSDSFYLSANLFLFLLLLPLSTIIHEIGHLVAATLVGAVPRRMTLGTGHEVHRFAFQNFKIVINSKPHGGHAMATWPERTQQNFRWRRAFHIMGGIIANAVVAFVLYLIFGLEIPQDEIEVGMMLMIANALGILNIIPRHTSAWNVKLGTDGMQLWKLFTDRDEKHFAVADKAFEAYEMMEGKNYGEASELFREVSAAAPENVLIRYNLSVALFKAGRFEESVELLEDMQGQAQTNIFSFILPLIQNQIAWHHLVMGNGDVAMQHASAAYALDPKSPAIKSTYASALIETGKANDGVQLLACDQRFVNSNTLSAAIYLASGYEQLGGKQRASMYREFVLKHVDKLDLDERMLFERLLIHSPDLKVRAMDGAVNYSFPSANI